MAYPSSSLSVVIGNTESLRSEDEDEYEDDVFPRVYHVPLFDFSTLRLLDS